MIQKLKNKLLILGTLLVLVLPAAAPIGVLADNTDTGNATIQGSLCQGADQLSVSESATKDCASLGKDAKGGESRLNQIIKTVINVFSVIVGVVAVIMIIVAGFRYITSGGKQESVTAAKNTILYALIGLVIVALSQIIVKFVLSKAAG